MSQKYRIDRITLISSKKLRNIQKKKILKSCRCRYLAKSHIVNSSAKNQKYDFVNFRGSIFTKVCFDKSIIYGCDFWGTTFKNCSFIGATITDCVFMACKFHNCNFTDTDINYTTIVNTSLDECHNIDLLDNVKIYTEYPKLILTEDMKNSLNTIKYDKNLRKNKLLHISDTKLNCLNIFMLLQRFKKEELPILLLEVCKQSTATITTYKKLESLLKKAKNRGIL